MEVYIMFLLSMATGTGAGTIVYTFRDSDLIRTGVALVWTALFFIGTVMQFMSL